MNIGASAPKRRSSRALAWLDDLRSLWEVEPPDLPEHAGTRREYELRRPEATAAAFERLEVLGPVIVEAKVAEDLLAGRADTATARRKRELRAGDRTKRPIGRGERSGDDDIDAV